MSLRENLAGMSVRTRLFVGFLVVFGLMLGVVAVAIADLHKVNRINRHIIQHDWLNASLAYELGSKVRQTEAAALELLVSESPERVAQLSLILQDGPATTGKLLAQLEPSFTTDEELEIMKRLASLQGVFNNSIASIAASVVAGDRATAIVIMNKQTLRIRKLYEPKIEELITLVKQRVTLASDRSDATYQASLRKILLLTALAVIAGVGASLLITRQLLRLLGGEPAAAVGYVQRLARGDLSGEIPSLPNDRTSLVANIALMQGELKAVIADIQQVTAAASQGDFTRRAKTEGLSGFGLDISSSLNTLISTTQEGVTDVERVVSAVARGDLSQVIHRDYSGDFNLLKISVNHSVASLDALLVDLNRVTYAASQGNLSQVMAFSGREGFHLEVARHVNGLITTCADVLNALSSGLHGLADGDLESRLHLAVVGQFAVARDDFNASVDKLASTMERINESMNVVKDAADDIATSNGDLTKRTDEAAKSLEETAASMATQAISIRDNAASTGKADTLAREAIEIAGRGGHLVTEVVSIMKAVAESSHKVANIVSVIDSIAFQTNILALNAAVEAARAGEHGRGFAVVATEVRQLALRSATAAKEIKVLIDGAEATVQTGYSLAEKTGRSMDDLDRAIREVSAVIAQISRASNQQSEAVDQMSGEVAKMKQGSQQNAAMAGQIGLTLAHLEAQADTLAMEVGAFRIAGPPA